MNLTDEELMLLEQLTYLEDIVFDAAGVTKRPLDSFNSVSDLINYFSKMDPETGEWDETHLAKLDGAGVLKYPNDPDNPDDDTDSLFLQGNEWAALFREIRDNEKLMSLAIYRTELYGEKKEDEDPGIKRAREPKTRIDYMVFCEMDGDEYDLDHAIVCFDGTLGALEWKDNIRLLLSGDTEINEKLIEMINNLPFKAVSVVGHSKGANKAAYLFYLCDKVVYGVLMDCPGFPSLFYEDKRVEDGIKKAEENNSLHQYAVDKDFVNIMLFRIKGAVYHYCQGFGQTGFAENHSPITFFAVLFDPHTNESRIVRNPDGSRLSFTEQDELMKVLDGFTMFVDDFMPMDDKEKVADYLGNVCVLALCLGPGDTYTVGGETYTKDDVAKYLFSDKETLSTIVAYLMVYFNRIDFGYDDIEGYIPIGGRIVIGLLFGFLFADDKLGWLFDEFKEGYKKGKFSSYCGIKLLEITALVSLFTGISKQDIEDVLMMSKAKAVEIHKRTSNFYPHTVITAPSTNVETITFDGSWGKSEGTGVDLPTLIPGTVPVKRGDFNLGPGPLQSTDEESLYIDNPIFQLHRNNIRDAADKLILDTEAFNSEDEVCGTDSMLLLANYHHQVAETTENYRGLMINPVDTVMDKMAQSIIEVDEKCSNSLRVNTAY